MKKDLNLMLDPVEPDPLAGFPPPFLGMVDELLEAVELADENGRGFLAKVEFTYYPPCPGAVDRYGLKLEPDTPAEIEVSRVVILEPLPPTEEMIAEANDDTYLAELCEERVKKLKEGGGRGGSRVCL